MDAQASQPASTSPKGNVTYTDLIDHAPMTKTTWLLTANEMRRDLCVNCVATEDVTTP